MHDARHTDPTYPSLLLAGVAWLAIPAAAAAAQEPVDPAAKDVILRQLAAFRAGDYQAAYGFASRRIRAQFDLAAFEQMVRSGYPQIARSTHACIAEARARLARWYGAGASLPVLLLRPNLTREQIDFTLEAFCAWDLPR